MFIIEQILVQFIETLVQYEKYNGMLLKLGLSTSTRLTVERTEYRLVKLVLGYSVKKYIYKQNVANIKICSV